LEKASRWFMMRGTLTGQMPFTGHDDAPSASVSAAVLVSQSVREAVRRGCIALPASLDGDADSLRAQLAPGGSVDVVYHLAGLARLRWLREMDCGTWHAEHAAKAETARAIAAVIAPKLTVHFSSLAAIAGSRTSTQPHAHGRSSRPRSPSVRGR
jgi:hypothetical protein